MHLKSLLTRWPAAVAVTLLLSGCAVPPIVSLVSLSADFASLGQSGKTVTDHGISLVMQQDCALLRVFQGPICRDIPDENTPEGALAALAPMRDPSMALPPNDPMSLPRELAYLDGALGLAVASGPVDAYAPLPTHAFASIRDELDAGHGEARHREAGRANAIFAGSDYLSAGILPARAAQ